MADVSKQKEQQRRYSHGLTNFQSRFSEWGERAYEAHEVQDLLLCVNNVTLIDI